MKEEIVNMTEVNRMNFADVPKKYRPIPFWSWNEKLNCDETREQIRQMDEAGMGGFFMHARGGLQTSYMEEEWFDNVTASLEEGSMRGMRPWAYDENGWPSGFGNGLVNGLGVDYQQKYLRMEDCSNHPDTWICRCGNHDFYYEVNPFYVDTLDKKVIAKFLEVAYKPYYERYKDAVEGFFTDEPQISRNGIPWSFVFPEEYAKRYGDDILTHLEELFLEVGDYKQTRIRFWKMVTELFSENFMKQIYEQCHEWGMKLTGHLVQEERVYSQLTSNGACMPHYEYMDIPGMDWLGRNIKEILTPYQLGSAAAQLGKDCVLGETFALCGHNVSFAELKGIFEWQMVHGVTMLCPHLEGYSIRGIRKRDYPPAMYVQQPWWEIYSKLIDSLSRTGMILSEGRKDVDVLVLHPQTTAWTLYNDRDTDALYELQAKTMAVIKELERKHVEFHLGDEILLERHGKVEDGKLVVGQQRYTYVIDCLCEELLPHTRALLDAFIREQGQLVTPEQLACNHIVDHPEITYTKREFDGYRVHYFVNTSPTEKEASFRLKGQMLDLYTGELCGFSGFHVFEPWGSVMVVEHEDVSQETACDAWDKTAAAEAAEANELHHKLEETIIRPAGTWRVVGKVMNSLTLDYCDYYFDGELQEKNGYVLNICERANALRRKVQIHQDYHVMLHTVPEILYLVCETPEQFTITINGKIVTERPDGYYVDKSFRRIDIAAYMQTGCNMISFDCDFVQPEEFYECLTKAYVFESEKNKLVYDMEIEAIYLVGDFCVKTSGSWEQLERYAVRYDGSFELDAPKTELSLKNLEQQGYPFFCGQLVLEGELMITGEHPVLELERRGINAVKVEINGSERWLLTSDRLSLKDMGAEGPTKIRLTLINNLRNLLGPHHLKEGESYNVGPGQFFKEPCVWNKESEKDWTDSYCFVETGI